MDSETWKILDRLLAEALDLPESGRGQWLAELAPGHRGLESTLRRLLHHATQVETGDFLETLPHIGNGGADRRCQPRVGETGAVIGPYRLLREIGHGGMGSVWLAERVDGLIARPVALKLPRFVTSDPTLAERIAAEREILATLAHPNIARLYDAGLDDNGQPFLALEFIAGLPIDQYCASRDLTLDQRLQLFAQVAEAVAYAHTKLVVHRDLKPANVLVNDEGFISLLDFGVAKLMSTSNRAGWSEGNIDAVGFTPDYASPEQILGQPISVAADVYSLGVILYELLTGARPYSLKSDSLRQLRDQIQTVDITLPSQRVHERRNRQQLQGDLDAIVRKALALETEQRYATVPAMIADLKRYRDGYPVLARDAGRVYRLRKLAKRHVGKTLAAGLTASAIVLGAGIAIWQARTALLERDRAEEMRDFVTSIIQSTNPIEMGPVDTPAGELLQQAVHRLEASDRMAPDTQIELMTTLANSLGHLRGAETTKELIDRTVAQASNELGEDHPLTLHARSVQLASLRRTTGRLMTERDAIVVLPDRIRAHPDSTPEQLLLALTNRMALAQQDWDYAAAKADAIEAVQIAEQHFGPHHAQTLSTRLDLADIYRRNQEFPTALSMAQRAHSAVYDRLRLAPSHPLAIKAMMVYGQTVAEGQDLLLGIEYIREAVQQSAQVLGVAAEFTAYGRGRLARLQDRAGQLSDAITNYQIVLQDLEAKVGRRSTSYTTVLSNLSRLLVKARRVDEALTYSAEFTRLAAELGGALPYHANTHAAQLARGLALLNAGHLNQADQMLEALSDDALRRRPGSLLDPIHVEAIYYRLSGEFEIALAMQQAALAEMTAANEGPRNEMHVLTEVGLNQIGLQHFAEADATLTQALHIYQQRQPTMTPRQADALVGLAQAKLGLDQPDKALELIAEADAYWQDYQPASRWAGEALWWHASCLAELGAAEEATSLRRKARRILGRDWGVVVARAAEPGGAPGPSSDL